MMSFVTIIVTLGVLVFFHELGHLMTAKHFGIGVKVFSLGFGPKLASRTLAGTEYRLSLVPLGGYVSFKEKDAPQDEHVPGRSFEETSGLVRSLVVLAGPVANIVLAFVLFWGLLWYNGLSVLLPVVGEVQASSPAERAGIRSDDTIVSIAGVEVSDWNDVIHEMATTQGNPFTLVLLRSGTSTHREEVTLHVTPEKRTRQNFFGETETVGFLGINPKGPWQDVELNVIESAVEGLSMTWETTAETAKAFYMLLGASEAIGAIGGPIMISQAISDHAEQGFSNLLLLIAIVSVNLAVVNLLPLPVLDGGHILMFAIEAVRGRPISEEMQKSFQRIGLAVILILMLLGTYNDIMRL